MYNRVLIIITGGVAVKQRVKTCTRVSFILLAEDVYTLMSG